MPFRRTCFRASVVLAIGIWSMLFAEMAAARPLSRYDRLLAEARAFAAEGSHALAQAAFVKALPLAPDDEQRRWCRFWALEQEKAENRTAERGRVHADLTELLAPYERPGAERDAFWAAATSAMADSHRVDLLLEVARFWALQPPSPAAAEAFAGAFVTLGRALADQRTGNRELILDAEALIRRALDSRAFAGEARAPLLALLHARILQLHPGDLGADPAPVTLAYEKALALAAGSPFEAEARLYRADWMLRSGPWTAGQWSGHDSTAAARRAPPSGDDFRTMLATIDEALAQAPRQPPRHRMAQLIESLRERRRELSTPSLRVETSDAYLPDSRFSFAVLAQHIGEVELRLFRVDLPTLDAVAFRSHTAPEPALPATPLHAWSLKTGIEGSWGRMAVRRWWPEALAPGAYVLEARDAAPGSATPAVRRWFLVTKLQGVAQRIGGGDLEVGVADSVTGQWTRAIQGSLRWDSGTHSLVPVESGRARVPLRDLPPGSGPARVIGEANGHPFVIPHLYLSLRSPSSWRLHLFADRPLYQPGETVQWKLTVRRTEGGELRVPAGERVKISARAAGDVRLGDWTMTLDALGSVSGRLALPAGMKPGKVDFAVSGDDDRPLGTIDSFQVEHFRAPEATLAIEPADAEQMRQARAGGVMEFKLGARYFSGEPLGHARIRTVTRFLPHPYFPLHDGREGSLSRALPQALTIPVTTNARGEAMLRVALPAGLPAYGKAQLEAELDAAGVVARATFSFELLPRGHVAELASATQESPQSASDSDVMHRWIGIPRVVVAPDQPFSLALFVRDGRSTPVRVPGEIAVERVEWDEVWRTPDGEFVTGAALRDHQRQGLRRLRGLGWEQIRAIERREAVDGHRVASEATGRTVVRCAALPAGYYRVSFWPDEPEGPDRAPSAQLDLFVADETTSWLSFHTDRPVLVPADSHPGEPVRVLAVLPHGGRQALVGIGGVAVGESRFETFSGNARLMAFDWKPGYWSGTKVAIAVPGVDQEAGADVHVVPARSAHAARVEIVPAAAQARPGESARLRIRMTDAAGQPVAGEVALAVADLAVTSLVPEKRGTASDTFLAPEYVAAMPASFGARPVSRGRASSPGANPAPQLEEMVTLSPFEVSASPEGGYMAANTLAGSRMNAAVSTDAPVRGTFSHTAFWMPAVQADAQGEAEVEFSYPDNLTQWQITAEAIAPGNRFGRAQAGMQTTLPFQARLRVPRSVVAGDTIGVVGALVNASAQEVSVRAGFETLSPVVLAPASVAQAPTVVPASGEARIAGEFRALKAGEGRLRLKALAEDRGDAMELRLPVAEDGFVQQTGVTARATSRPVTVSLRLPVPLHPDRTRVELQVSPGIVPALVEGLPYLIDYPYGCVEQTMSRFLPAVVVARLLRDLGLDPAGVEKRLLAGAHAGTRQGPGLGRLNEVVDEGLARLAAAQNSDGSFGWFGGGSKDPYMTAYVLRGLGIAAGAGVEVPEPLLAGTAKALWEMLDDKSGVALAPEHGAWALAAFTSVAATMREDADVQATLGPVFDDLYALRDRLPPAGVALLAQAARGLGRADALPVLRRNLENAVDRASSAEYGPTAQWGRTSGYFRGLEGAVETTALCLQALLAIDPLDPLADAAATWLLVNRQSGRWHNTRDTALSLLALHDYARARGATVVEGRYRLSIGAHAIAERSFDRGSLLQPATFAVDARLLQPGVNRITLARLEGGTPCFLVATARSWAAAETARPMGSFITVQRDYLGISRRLSLIGALLPQTSALFATNALVAADDLVECRLVVEAKHDLEYVAVEVPRPGGCEPVNALSGWDATLRRLEKKTDPGGALAADGGGRPVYREEHPDRSVFFLPRVEAGRWEIRYRMRAVFPGDYRALPATVEAMYVPALDANTEARRLRISPAAQPQG